MKTIFHDNETGVDLQIEGGFRNTKARTIDKDGNILMEFEGTYSELLKVVDEWSKSGVEDIEFEVGDIVKVRQGKENGGAIGYAKITHIRYSTGVAELEGTDNDGIFSDGYVNAIRNLEKIK